MTPPDRDYLRKLIKAGHITSPCLELGAQYADLTMRSDIVASGIAYVGTDMVEGANVVVIADFNGSPASIQSRFAPYVPVGTVVIANVLEQPLKPIHMPAYACALLRPGG